ncbi:MAG: DUF2550 domain-containing protein [Nocardioidaceae bacterium]
MPWWTEILDVVGLLAVIAAAVFVSLFVRRRVLSRQGGTFECSLRTKAPAKSSATGARGWELGLGRYNGESLEWFRVFSFSPRPKAVFDRSLQVLTQRTPHGAEAFSLYAGHTVVAVRIDSGSTVELAMSDRALTAFMAWTEAAPPGQDRLLT